MFNFRGVINTLPPWKLNKIAPENIPSIPKGSRIVFLPSFPIIFQGLCHVKFVKLREGFKSMFSLENRVRQCVLIIQGWQLSIPTVRRGLDASISSIVFFFRCIFPMGKLGWDLANVMYLVERLFFLSNCHEETCANAGMIRLSFATCDYFWAGNVLMLAHGSLEWERKDNFCSVLFSVCAWTPCYAILKYYISDISEHCSQWCSVILKHRVCFWTFPNIQTATAIVSLCHLFVLHYSYLFLISLHPGPPKKNNPEIPRPILCIYIFFFQRETCSLRIGFQECIHLFHVCPWNTESKWMNSTYFLPQPERKRFPVPYSFWIYPATHMT